VRCSGEGRSPATDVRGYGLGCGAGAVQLRESGIELGVDQAAAVRGVLTSGARVESPAERRSWHEAESRPTLGRNPTMTISTTDARTLMETPFAEMSSGNLEAFGRAYHPTARNRATGGPPACSTPGAEGFHSGALWLRGMFSDLAWDVHEAIAQDDLIAAYTTMRGRHTGPLTTYSLDGELVMDIPATGKSSPSRRPTGTATWTA
jgi:hypothetical protein